MSGFDRLKIFKKLHSDYSLCMKYAISTHAGGLWSAGVSVGQTITLSRFGLRMSEYNGHLIELSNLYSDKFSNFGLVLGGSCAFGVYSTSDRNTLASNLSRSLSIPFFSIAQPGDTILGQSFKCLGLVNKFPRISKARHIIMFVGFNELYWLLQTPFLTPYGYLEKQKHFFFGDTIQYSNLSSEPFWDRLNYFLDQKTLEVNEAFFENILQIDAASVLKIVWPLVEEHYSLGIRLLKSFFSESKLTVVIQPSACSSAFSLSQDELFLQRDWIKGLNHDTKRVFNLITSGLMESLSCSDEYLPNLVRSLGCDFINLLKVRSDLGHLGSVILADECHLTDDGFLGCATMILDILKSYERKQQAR